MTIASCSRDLSRFAYFKDVQTYILSRPYYIGESFIQEILYLSIAVCSGQLIPDSKLVRFSAFAGGTPLLN